MKKLIYLTAITGSLLLTTSCVDLTQEPESFITEEQYTKQVFKKPQMLFIAIYGKVTTDLTAACNVLTYVRTTLRTVRPKPITNWHITED